MVVRCSTTSPSTRSRRNLDEGAAHLIELSELAKNDPEFYKYLQENDKDLLEFNPDNDDPGSEDEEEEEDVDMDEAQEATLAPVLTKKQLQRWQKSLLEVLDHSLSKIDTLNTSIAPFTSGVEKTHNRVPFRCTHERREPGTGIHD